MILKQAASAMRRHGPDGVGVAGIMRGLGLTHGGFYAHFASKDDLIAHAVAEMFAESARRYARDDGLASAAKLAAFIDRYVSEAHRDRPERGCPLTTITGDIARQSEAAKAAFDAGVARMIEQLAAMLAGMLPGGADAQAALATSLLSEMAGAVALSRAVSDRAASNRILAAAREAVRLRAGFTTSNESHAA